MANTLLFLLTMGLSGWLFIWMVRVERNPGKYLHRFPFGTRDMEQFRKKYGDKLPF